MMVEARATSRAPSREGRKPIAGYFSPEVVRELKKLAVEKDVTLQTLLAVAINDLFERHGKNRLADESPLPRGGAAHHATRGRGG